MRTLHYNWLSFQVDPHHVYSECPNKTVIVIIFASDIMDYSNPSPINAAFILHDVIETFVLILCHPI